MHRRPAGGGNLKTKHSKRGRPAKRPALVLKRVSIRLRDDQIRLYAQAGGGDLSAGVRRALDVAGPPSEWPTPPVQ